MMKLISAFMILMVTMVSLSSSATSAVCLDHRMTVAEFTDVYQAAWFDYGHRKVVEFAQRCDILPQSVSVAISICGDNQKCLDASLNFINKYPTQNPGTLEYQAGISESLCSTQLPEAYRALTAATNNLRPDAEFEPRGTNCEGGFSALRSSHPAEIQRILVCANLHINEQGYVVNFKNHFYQSSGATADLSDYYKIATCSGAYSADEFNDQDFEADSLGDFYPYQGAIVKILALKDDATRVESAKMKHNSPRPWNN